jgi:type I restriction enzyme S subunit
MGEMMERPSVPLEQLVLESKDGEWGEAAEKSGYILCNIIRGTDFRNTSNTNIKFPQRYIKQHLADRKRLQPFDLLIETAGGTATQSTGKTVLVKESLLSGSGTPFLCSSFARYIRLKKDGINPQFLQYFLEASYKNDYMRVYNTQHTGVSRFQWSDFKKRTAIPLPPAPVQVNIAAILSAYDDTIENNNRRIAVLEKMAEEIYREWFVRMRFPGYEKVKFHKGVPEGWTPKVMKDIGDVVDCLHTKKPESTVDGEGWLLQLENIGENGRLNKKYKYLISKSDYQQWTKNIEV